MRALVTGAGGFVGQWLCRELLGRGWAVTGTLLGDAVGPAILSLGERRAVRWVSADVTDPAALARAIDAAAPDAVAHLAGIAAPGDAAADPRLAFSVNTGAAGVLASLLAERRRAGTLDARLLVVGSAEQYGRHDPAEQPLSECAAQRPISVYGASKAAQEVVALAACRGAGVPVVATRSFNHSGPGQGEHFLIPALVSRALAARTSWQPTIRLGSTTPVRDFLHVRDVARAYASLLERGEAGAVYNVASGRGWSVQAVAERVLALAGVHARLESDPALVRPVEIPVLVGSPERLRAATGWEPTADLDAIILDILHAAPR